MRYQLVALLFLGFAAPAFAAEDQSWLQQYYQQPRPDQFEAEVKKLQRSGALQKKSAKRPVAAFFSRLLQTAKPQQLSQWLKIIDELPEADQHVFLTALHWANTRATQAALRTITSTEASSASFAKKLLEVESPEIDKIKDPSPAELDMCWGAFFATGESIYALPVIRCAVKPAKGDAIDVAQKAAQWSLRSLCKTHPKLREIKDEFYKAASPQERKALDDLFLTAIETVEKLDDFKDEPPSLKRMPNFFSWDYKFEPEPGKRVWLRVDDKTFIERYPSGKENRFRILNSQKVNGIEGVIVQNADSSLQAFIPYKSAEQPVAEMVEPKPTAVPPQLLMRAEESSPWRNMGKMEKVQ